MITINNKFDKGQSVFVYLDGAFREAIVTQIDYTSDFETDGYMFTSYLLLTVTDDGGLSSGEWFDEKDIFASKEDVAQFTLSQIKYILPNKVNDDND